jgi:hypothetical protein
VARSGRHRRRTCRRTCFLPSPSARHRHRVGHNQCHAGRRSGTSAGPASPNACASAESRSPQALNCLDPTLRQQVDQINPNLTTPSAPLDARPPDTKIGIVNVPGVQQRYGQNFGVWAIPYRPPPLIYTRPSGVTDERRAEAVLTRFRCPPTRLCGSRTSKHRTRPRSIALSAATSFLRTTGRPSSNTSSGPLGLSRVAAGSRRLLHQ